MTSIIRTTTKLFIAAIAVLCCLHAAPASAVTFISSTGTDSPTCGTAQSPCATLAAAVNNAAGASSLSIACMNTPTLSGPVSISITTVTIDCLAGVFDPASGGINLTGVNQHVIIKNITFQTQGPNPAPSPAIQLTGSANLSIEVCTFDNFTGAAIDIAPNAPSTFLMRYSEISDAGAGMLIVPSAGGNITATLDGDSITSSYGGGLKTSSANASVTVDITDSHISGNGGAGINAVGGAGGPNVITVTRSTLAGNATVGIQANGATAAVLVDSSLLERNGAALEAINGGHITSYGTNRIIGSQGTGFTSTASTQ